MKQRTYWKRIIPLAAGVYAIAKSLTLHGDRQTLTLLAGGFLLGIFIYAIEDR